MSIRGQRIAILVVFVVPPTVICAVALMQTKMDAVDLFRDPLITASERYWLLYQGQANAGAFCCEPWLGAVSNLGVLVWAATAGALLTALASTWVRVHSTSRIQGFLGLAFVLTSLLALDDLFQLHEQGEIAGGLDGGTLMLPLLGLLAVSYLLFWKIIWTKRYVVLLALAGFLLGFSLGIDQVLPQTPTVMLIEDVPKFFGIFLWSAFHLLFAAEASLGRDVFFVRQRASHLGSQSTAEATPLSQASSARSVHETDQRL